MKSKNEIAEAFRRLCREHGIAATHQRQIIYQAVVSSNDHPTPELIYDRVREQLQTISLATVYKCLHTFLELSLVKPASLHYGSIRIDPNLEPHHHLVCRVCGKMSDVCESEDFSFSGPSKAPRGFQIEVARAEFIGTCADCLPPASMAEKTRSIAPRHPFSSGSTPIGSSAKGIADSARPNSDAIPARILKTRASASKG